MFSLRIFSLLFRRTASFSGRRCIQRKITREQGFCSPDRPRYKSVPRKEDKGEDGHASVFFRVAKPE
jgi:hypothetical protein